MTSTIDRSQPATNSALNSSPLRANFGAAANDIEALQATLSPPVATKSANYAAQSTDIALAFDASGAGSSGLICTVDPALGTVGAPRTITIERAITDASSNPIIVKDLAGVERGRIVSPVAVLVPWLAARADGTHVICRGVP